jgi:hypothetical protein
MKVENLGEVRKAKIAVGVIVIIVILIFVYNKFSSDSLQKNFIISNGYVISVKFTNKIGDKVHFTYSINHRTYSGFKHTPNFKNEDDKRILEGRYFPIVVDSTNNSKSDMLLDSLSFAQYGLQYPDSLRWLNKYLK